MESFGSNQMRRCMKTSKGEREIWTARSRVTERKKGLKIKIE
jgi:hypothetical protein